MKKNIMGLLSLVLSVVLSLSVNAQVYYTDQNMSVPVVPIDVLTKGGQAVAHYLIVTVDHVESALSGSSVVAPSGYTSRYFSLNELIDLGYKTRGSFTELSDALNGAQFRASVIPTPRGYYDVRVDLNYYDADNKIALKGSGWLDIYRQRDGTLFVSKVEPYVSINELVAVKFDNYVSAAKWIPRNGSSPVELERRWNGPNGMLVIVPGQAFEDGFLAISDEFGNTKAWDLESGAEIIGEQVVALLGATRSSDFWPIRNTINSSGVSAYRSGDDQIYGHVPLTEIFLDESVKDVYDLGVNVWGSQTRIYPEQVYVTPIEIEGDNHTSMEVGKEYPVPNVGNGSWFFVLPKGQYHMRMIIPEIKRSYGKG